MDFDGDVLIIVLVLIFGVGIGLIVKAFYLLTLQKAMEQVAEERREMPKGQVWLELIPIFNIVWQFFNVNRVTKSLENEFRAREMNEDELISATKIGKAFCILSVCGFVPFIGGLLSLGGFVCWIIFWVKMSGLKTKLENYQLHKIQHIQ